MRVVNKTSQVGKQRRLIVTWSRLTHWGRNKMIVILQIIYFQCNMFEFRIKMNGKITVVLQFTSIYDNLDLLIPIDSVYPPDILLCGHYVVIWLRYGEGQYWHDMMVLKWIICPQLDFQGFLKPYPICNISEIMYTNHATDITEIKSLNWRRYRYRHNEKNPTFQRGLRYYEYFKRTMIKSMPCTNSDGWNILQKTWVCPQATGTADKLIYNELSCKCNITVWHGFRRQGLVLQMQFHGRVGNICELNWEL